MNKPDDDGDHLLYVTSDPGANSLEQFHDWYDNEHIANRLPFKELSNATRWHAEDDATPQWLATYDVTRSLLNDPDYRKLRSHRSQRERAVIAAMSDFTRTTYKPKGPATAELGCQGSTSGNHLLSVRLYTAPERYQELIDWYIGEHIPRLLSIEGWLRVRVFVPADSEGGRTHVLALHDLSSLSGFATEEYRAATSTPWRSEVMARVTAKDRRIYALHRRF